VSKRGGSEVFVGLVEAHSLGCVDDKIASVDVVALEDVLEDLRLVHGALFHEANDLVLDHDGVIDIVIQLDLHLVLELAVLAKELLVVDGVRKVVVVLRQQVNFAVGSPRVEAVTHGVLRPNADVFTTTEKQQAVDLLVE